MIGIITSGFYFYFFLKKKNLLQFICQCIAQTNLAHWAQPSILYLQFTLITCTTHIPGLYKTLYYILLYTHQYTDYSIFFSHFILLIWYQSYFSDFLVPMDIFGVLSLPSFLSSSHCQKRVTAVTPTPPSSSSLSPLDGLYQVYYALYHLFSPLKYGNSYLLSCIYTLGHALGMQVFTFLLCVLALCMMYVYIYLFPPFGVIITVCVT